MKNNLTLYKVLNIILALAVVALLYVNKTNSGDKQVEAKVESFKKLPDFAKNRSATGILNGEANEHILPAPRIESNISLEECMYKRRSVRSYATGKLSLSELSQILWSGYGVTHSFSDDGNGLKTAPSAGARYPLELYVLVDSVDGLTQGLYKYVSAGHKMEKICGNNRIAEIAAMSENTTGINQAGAVIVFTGDPSKLFGDAVLDLRWTNMEVGHVAQNIYLQGTALNVGTCAVGYYEEEKVHELLEMPENEQVLYIMPLGKI